MYKVQLTKQACEDLDTLDNMTLNRIKSVLHKLARNPVPGKRLLGGCDGEWFYEVCKHLIVCQVNSGKMIVLMVKHLD